MRLVFPSLLFTTGLLLVPSLGAFAIQGTPAPPGNYTNGEMNTLTTPSAPFGYDMVLEENVPGAGQQPPNTVPPGGTPITYPAVQVLVFLNLNTSQTLNSAGNLVPANSKSIATITGPTGTYAANTVGVGKQTVNILSYTPMLKDANFYQYQFKVTWTDALGQHTNSAYGPPDNY